jgi:hypothetical protein
VAAKGSGRPLVGPAAAYVLALKGDVNADGTADAANGATVRGRS